MMLLPPLGLALLIWFAAAPAGRADEASERLLTAFRNICLVKPDSIWAIGALATAQGFKPGAIGPSAAAKTSAADQYNLLNTWERGENKEKIGLTGLTGGNPLQYQVLCAVDAADVLPGDIIAAIKAMPGIGEPAIEKHKDSNGLTLRWKIPADPRRDSLSVDYDPDKGRQRVSLSFEQAIETPVPK